MLSFEEANRQVILNVIKCLFWLFYCDLYLYSRIKNLPAIAVKDLLDLLLSHKNLTMSLLERLVLVCLGQRHKFK